MAPFGGWDMPIQYEGILAEHAWTRSKATIFDTCHMGEFELRGPTAEADLERLVTQSVAGIAVGQCRYGYLLRDDGGAPHSLVLTATDITELKRTEDAFRNMSYLDPLTKLANRRLLQDRLHAAVAQARREQRSLALLFVDLDEFKPINDRLGHETGDWLLKAVARRLLDCIRASDTAARFGGDEFVVLLPDLAQIDDVPRVAERIRKALAAPFVTDDGEQLEISCSIGMSLYPDHAETGRELLLAGDEAMYLAKRGGRNRIVRSERTPNPIVLAAAD
jgi:diguanylate cyclase (GGDEF)-like protein